MEEKLFDASGDFMIAVPHPDFPDKKRCKVRFPTDEEWCARQRKRVTVRRSLGRDAVKTEVLNADSADLELFNKIREDGGPEFDEAEASVGIELLALARVESCERVGSNYVVTMKVPKAVVIHTLKTPTLQQTKQYGKAAFSVTGKRFGSESRELMEPAGALWDDLNVSTSGYAGPVPIIHKDAALTEVLIRVNSEVDDEDPE